jgi:hypothetical protein
MPLDELQRDAMPLDVLGTKQRYGNKGSTRNTASGNADSPGESSNTAAGALALDEKYKHKVHAHA